MKLYFYSITQPPSKYNSHDVVVSGLLAAPDAASAFKQVKLQASGTSAERMYGPLDCGNAVGYITAFNYVEDV